MSQDITPDQIAMLRGVKNCGRHHEENKLSPAVQFAQECDRCTAEIFAVIWNAGVKAELANAIQVVRERCRR
jgi:hypothetical protein